MIIQSNANQTITRFKNRLGLHGEVSVLGHYIIDRRAATQLDKANFSIPMSDLEKKIKHEIEMRKVEGTKHTITIIDKREPDMISGSFKIGACTTKDIYVFTGGEYVIQNIGMDDYVALIVDSNRDQAGFQLVAREGENEFVFDSISSVANNPPIFSVYRAIKIIISNQDQNPFHIFVEVLNYE